MLYWIKKHYNTTIDWGSSITILLSSAAAAAITYAVTYFLNLPNWIKLIFGASIFTAAYLTIAPLTGAINKTDTKNLKETLKETSVNNSFSSSSSKTVNLSKVVIIFTSR